VPGIEIGEEFGLASELCLYKYDKLNSNSFKIGVWPRQAWLGTIKQVRNTNLHLAI
jgi:hypothetical protein